MREIFDCYGDSLPIPQQLAEDEKKVSNIKGGGAADGTVQMSLSLYQRQRWQANKPLYTEKCDWCPKKSKRTSCAVYHVQ